MVGFVGGPVTGSRAAREVVSPLVAEGLRQQSVVVHRLAGARDVRVRAVHAYFKLVGEFAPEC